MTLLIHGASDGALKVARLQRNRWFRIPFAGDAHQIPDRTVIGRHVAEHALEDAFEARAPPAA